ncbi:unnamed protein product [Bemisia tabaci]|uniref:Uncharacterized protein n=1 Tax=Bemisia tabaci TaxID=7038 RepID=A0A9P0A0Y7_BEMTA|nr:unnamed protein product [Bemisia tabaci]
MTFPARASRGRTLLLDEGMASALDRTQTTNRNAVYLMASSAKSCGLDVKKLVMNEKSIRRARAKFREDSAKRIQNNFAPDVPLTVHWDGKLLPSLTGREKVDRLPILVSGYGIDQLLAVAPLSSGTGKLQASAVYEAIDAWNLRDKVKSKCFDTASTNAGIHNGACINLERLMTRPLLNLACRHHIPELILESAITCSIGPTNQPEHNLFTKFRGQWDHIDQSNYKTALEDPGTLKSFGLHQTKRN